MRSLTFKGFLRAYIRELTGSETRSLAKLASFALGSYPRVAEPLFMRAVMEGSLPRLLQEVQETRLEKHYRLLAKQFSYPSTLLEALGHKDKRLPGRYLKVYDSYQSKAMRIETDRNVTLMMRAKTVGLMHKKGLSTYRVYTDLGLNHGNINAFIKNADATKVSRQTARAILEYVESA